MRIAFTSCSSNYICKDQPVWDEIRDARPNVLVLLGDSVYFDCSYGQHMGSLKEMSAQQFAEHVHLCYTKQLAQPEFARLLNTTTMPIHAIWDDHDFLWNGAAGADLPAQLWGEHVAVARFYFAAFQHVLATRKPGEFPTSTQWNKTTPAPGLRTVKLTGDGEVLLHLTDGRSFRSARHDKLVGDVQMQQLEDAIQAAPAAIHIIASGSTFESLHGESWAQASGEHEKLCKLARGHKLLMLSGDVHKALWTAHDLGEGKRLYEATGSGAGVRSKVTQGSPLRNFGLLDIDPSFVRVRLSQLGKRTDYNPISRADWQQAG